MTGVGQQSRVLLHHTRHPKPRHGGRGIGWGGRARVGGGRIALSRAKTKGAHADKGQGKGWGVPLGSGTSHKGCDKGHQGKHADKGNPVEGKGWGVLPGHADKGKPVEGKGLGYTYWTLAL